jgi:uncharacterized membrane protein
MPEGKPYHIEPHIEAALGYIPGVALAILAMEKENKITRFHAFQSIFFWALAFAVYSMAHILRYAVIGIFLAPLVNLAILLTWIYLTWKTINKETVELPIIGRLAQEQTHK